jgi:hypothetical protein
MPVTMPCDVRLLNAGEGGREAPLTPGWRGLAWFGELWTEEDAALWPSSSGPLSLGKPLVYGVELGLTKTESLEPGTEGLGEITFLFLDELRPSMHVGAEFELREGDRQVGTGQILGMTGGAL